MNRPHSDSDYVPSDAALEILRIKPQTLYTYVSRGLIRRLVQPSARISYYNLHDIRRLQARSRARSGHGPVAASAMHWGEPILETSITEITPQGPRYREHLATGLAHDDYSFEAVAEHLWTGSLATDVRWNDAKRAPRTFRQERVGAGGTHFRHVLTNILVQLDQGRVDSGEDALELRSARELIRTMAGAFGYLGPRRTFVALKPDAPIALSLARMLGIPANRENVRALNAALVLVADHELTSPTFAARIAASVGSNLESCIVAALQVHFGSVLGLCCDRVDELIESAPRNTKTALKLDSALMTMRATPGFDHPLYSRGDPRAQMMLEFALSIEGCQRRATAALDMLEASLPDVRAKPHLCEALVVLCRALGAGHQAASGLLALGRSAGWIAHVIEQRQQAFLIRPRGKFVAQADEA
jgi:citrate synthase